jgi:alpha-ketoglutarate-dependent taurine dioxygenase
MIEWRPELSTLPLIGINKDQHYNSHQLQQWLMANIDQIYHLLYIKGALLFRGFSVISIEEFQGIASIFCDKFGDYLGGNSPRTRVATHVFTSTEYPKEERISMHNEASYLTHMPSKILFFCLKPATKGGQTPLADCRRVLNRIDSEVRKRFDRSGIRYINNLHSGIGFGKSWMETYGTKDRKVVEKYLADNCQAFEWKPNGTLRICMQAPATLRHPKTKEEVWINQAEQWHSSNLESDLLEDLLTIISEGELPHNAYLGDGSPLCISDLENIRAAIATEEHIFEWQAGDILLCDNLLVMHGRQAYSGDRKVFAAMG